MLSVVACIQGLSLIVWLNPYNPLATYKVTKRRSIIRYSCSVINYVFTTHLHHLFRLCHLARPLAPYWEELVAGPWKLQKKKKCWDWFVTLSDSHFWHKMFNCKLLFMLCKYSKYLFLFIIIKNIICKYLSWYRLQLSLLCFVNIFEM